MATTVLSNRILKVLGLALAALLGALLAHVSLTHASFLPLPSTTDLEVPAPEGDTAFQKLENLLGPLGRNLRIIVGAVAVVFIVVAGFSMVISGQNEETAKKQKTTITYAVIGLIMISIAGPIAEVFDYRTGNVIGDGNELQARVKLFDETTKLIITFLKYLLGGLATLMFVRAGALMVMFGDNDEDVGKEKKNLALGAAGLTLVMFSDFFLRRVFYVTEFNASQDTTTVKLDANEFLRQLVAITNLMVSFVAPIMMLALVAGGVLYASAGGDEERTNLAKKIIKNSLIGIIIIYGAFAIVSTIISGTF